MILPTTLPTLALPASVVILLAALARIFDPYTGATPLISGDARGYYLAASVILGLVLAAEVARRGMAAPGLPHVVAGWSLIVGSATLLFATDTGAIAFLAMLALVTAEIWTREAGDTTGATLPYAARAIVVALLWVFLFGLLTFHLRWLFALPVAGLAGGLAYLRFDPTPIDNLRERVWPGAVAGLATMQMVAAVSFLDISAALGATLIVLSLSAIVAAGRFDWERIAA